MKAVKIIAIVILALLLVAWGVSSYLTVDDLVACDATPSTRKGCHAADAIVAVSGGDTSARAKEAIKLYKNGWAPIIIFSGAAADKSGPSNASVMQQLAINEGVDPIDILIEENSETTHENAKETSTIFTKRSMESAILVTSAYHERRVMLEFERSTKDVELRGHPVASDNQWGPLWWLTPTGWMLAIPEVVQSLLFSISVRGGA